MSEEKDLKNIIKILEEEVYLLNHKYQKLLNMYKRRVERSDK